MNARIGYFVPEFPGQTHIFFWREIAVLEEMGIGVDVVSTRRPPSAIMSHTWTTTAQERTTYLFPPTPHLPGILLELLRAGPVGWLRCLKAIANARDVSATGRLRLLALVLIGAELAHLARAHKWQYIHVHSCADAANVALFAFLLARLPYSLTLHGPLSDYGSNQEQKWQFARLGIVITHKLYDEVHKHLATALPEAIEVAPMGVDLTTFSRQTAYQPWQGAGACRIFSCGRLNPCKGHADLITAIGLLRQQGLDVTLTIAGEDEQGGTGYHRELESHIQQLGLSESVQLLGAVSEDVVREQLESAHVFALASLSEPLGVAIMEAMALELPVVVTGAGGVKELVDSSVEGLLVQPNAPEQIAESITTVMQNPQQAIDMGKAARAKIVRQFHAKRSAEVLAKQILVG